MFEALILGIVQGVTEFIPVSSSGHLIFFHELFGSDGNNLAFDIALHVGTLFAVVIYFRYDLAKLIRGVIKGKQQDKNLVLLLALGTVPAVIAGLLFNDIIEASLRSPWVVVVMLALFGGVMIFAEEKSSKIKKKQNLENLQTGVAIRIGMLQSLALIPGVSRSGATISVGLLLGLDRVAATRFSFLLAIPVIFGAAAKTFLDGGVRSEIAANQAIFIIGAVTAFLSGLLAISFLLRFVAKYSIRSFAYYRFAIAGVIAIVLILNR